MFSIASIEIQNIRAHESVTITPPAQGITAITGRNGAGKSTILDAVAWALFGLLPPDVKTHKSLIRETVVPSHTTPVGVTLVLDFATVTWRVACAIVDKRGKRECTVWTKPAGAPDSAYVQAVGPAISHTQAWINRELGQLTADGYLAAVHVQQKTVDAIVKSDPATRTKIIERLLGIDVITTAKQTASTELRALKRSLKDTTVDMDRLPALQHDQAEAANTLSELRVTLAAQQAHLNQVIEEGRAARTVETELNDAALAAERVIAQRDAAKLMAGQLQGLIDEVLAEQARYQRELRTNDVGDVATIEANLTALREAHTAHHTAYQQACRDYDTTAHQIRVLTDRIADTPWDSLDAATDAVATHTANAATLNTTIQTLEADAADRNARCAALLESVETLRAMAEATCPTCRQPVEDPEALIDSLLVTHDMLKFANGEVQDNLINTRCEWDENNQTLTLASQAVDDFTALPGLEADLATHAATRDTALAERDRLVNRLDAAQAQYKTAASYAALDEQRKALADKGKRYAQDLNHQQSLITTLSSELDAMTIPSSRDLADAKRTIDQVTQAYQQANQAATTTAATIAQLEERLTQLDRQITDEQARVDAYTALKSTVETMAGAEVLLQTFRSEYVLKTVPELSELASVLLARFTDGAFVAMNLDETFSVSVLTADGTERPLSMLSGGEASTAALALRLAVAMLLNRNSAHSTLLLDEVLVAQDANRCDLILQCIREVIGGQIILVAHNNIIDSVADHLLGLPLTDTQALPD